MQVIRNIAHSHSLYLVEKFFIFFRRIFVYCVDFDGDELTIRLKLAKIGHSVQPSAFAMVTHPL